MTDSVEIVEVTPAAPLVVEVEVPGTPGPPGPAGDQNVLLLQHDEEVPEGTPDGKIIYRLLEA